MATVITQGWDLIAAITQQSLNTLVASAFSQGVVPSTFTQPLSGNVEVSVTISAPTVDLNPQQPPGQSGMVAITFPIVSGSISAPNVPTINIPVGASIEILTVMAYVTIDSSGGSTEKLSLDFNNPLAVFNVIITDPSWPASQTSVLAAAFKVFLQGLAPGSVNLGSVNVPSQGSVLAPVGAADFAVQIASDPNLNTLLLLMVTSSGTPGSVDFSNSPPLIPAGQQGALYISNRVLIQEIIVPQMAAKLTVQPSAFTIQGSATTPYTAMFSGDQSIPNAPFDSEMINLVVNVNDSQQVQAAYTVDAHPLFNADGTYYIEVTGNMFVSIVLNGQTISFSTSADNGSGSLQCSWLGWVIIVAAIVASFGTLGAFIGSVLAIVVPIVITYLQLPIALPSSLLAQIDQALGSFTWPAQTNFPLVSIQLPGDLVFFGTPQV